jgi:hypothetical protein
MDGANDQSRTQVIDLNAALASVISEVHEVLPHGCPVDCGDLFAACLLEPSTKDNVSEWCSLRIEDSALLAWVRSHDRAGVEDVEGPAGRYTCNEHSFVLTAWSSFLLRFLATCESSGFQSYVLMAGLIEIAPPSVRAFLGQFGFDGQGLLASLRSRTFVMWPPRSEGPRPYYQSVMGDFYHWCVCNESIKLVEIWDDRDLFITLMLEWLSECPVYQEISGSAEPRLGDVFLFGFDKLRALCVFDEGKQWRLFVGDCDADAIARPENALRAFRHRPVPRSQF